MEGEAKSSKVSTWKRDRLQGEPEVNLRLPRELVRDLGLDKNRVTFLIRWTFAGEPLLLCFRETERKEYS